MTSQPPSICFACTHLRPSVDPNTGTPTVGRCDAYPDAIPFDVALGADHRAARGDEHADLTFVQAGSNDDAREAFFWWDKTFGTAAP